jgi:hypothetical protein
VIVFTTHDEILRLNTASHSVLTKQDERFKNVSAAERRLAEAQGTSQITRIWIA